MASTRSSSPATGQPDIRAAGVVTFRKGRQVLLVHRPKYDDWSFPKGKLDRGEHPAAAAVREAAEETGVHVRLGPPLPDQRYPTGRRMKTVHYWTGRVVGDEDVSSYRPNDEIDEVRWVHVDEAPALLTYPRDRETLAAATKVRRKTHAVVVLRHAQARNRKAWRGDDDERPLLKVGHTQAYRLVPVLAAYGVTRVVSSPGVRCLQTVEPYVDTTGWDLETAPELSEADADPDAVEALVDGLVEGDQNAVLCTHRPVLPLVLDALALKPSKRGPELAVAEMLVAHVRKGAVVAWERHRVS